MPVILAFPAHLGDLAYFLAPKQLFSFGQLTGQRSLLQPNCQAAGTVPPLCGIAPGTRLEPKIPAGPSLAKKLNGRKGLALALQASNQSQCFV